MCAHPTPLQDVAARHGLPLLPPTKGCESRRRLVRIVPPIYGLWHCFTHTSCICNDYIACVNRVIGRVPLPTAAGVQMIKSERLKLQRKMGTFAPLSLEEALATFKGSRAKLYQQAYESLRVEPYGDKDGMIKAFVKAERFDPDDKINPDPRMIQARSPRYNLHLARYLRSIEHHIYGMRVNGDRVVAKCLNPEQRAEMLFRKMAKFDNPVVVSLDASRWDKHVSAEVLAEEHALYRACYPEDPMLDRLLNAQMNNKCTTSNGLKYQVLGGRMSGDMNTALGNVTLMVLMVKAAMRKFNISYDIINDGDDCLLIFEGEHLDRIIADLPKIFLEFGQELKVENIAFDPRQVVFCQSRITWNGERYIFARNWRKVLSQSCCGTKHWNIPAMVPKMFGLIGDCEMAQHAGIPILQAFASRLRELSGGQRATVACLDSSQQYRIGSWNLNYRDAAAREITWRARAEFEITWGVSINEQLAIERQLATWTPSIVARDTPLELDPCDWTQRLDPGIPTPTVL